jgi:hypothetical protein
MNSFRRYQAQRVENHGCNGCNMLGKNYQMKAASYPPQHYIHTNTSDLKYI